MVVNLVNMLIQKGILDAENQEGYIYALTMLCERFITYMVLFVLAILNRQLIQGIIYTISFVLLRQTTGGYHAKNFKGCLIGTVTLFLLSLNVFVPLLDKNGWVAVLALFVSVLCIWIYAPVNHPNLVLSEIEIKTHRLWSRIVVSAELGLIILGICLQMCWQQYIILGIISCAVLILIAKLTGQEVKKK